MYNLVHKYNVVNKTPFASFEQAQKEQGLLVINYGYRPEIVPLQMNYAEFWEHNSHSKAAEYIAQHLFRFSPKTQQWMFYECETSIAQLEAGADSETLSALSELIAEALCPDGMGYDSGWPFSTSKKYKTDSKMGGTFDVVFLREDSIAKGVFHFKITNPDHKRFFQIGIKEIHTIFHQ